MRTTKKPSRNRKFVRGSLLGRSQLLVVKAKKKKLGKKKKKKRTMKSPRRRLPTKRK